MIPLLEAGFAVEGYDNSPQMLAVCRERCAERGFDPVLFKADMTSFTAANSYAAVIVPTGSITLLCGRDALSSVLAGFRECLESGGRLLIDVPAPELLSGAEPMRTWSEGSSVWTLQTMHIEYDAAKNQTTRWLRYEKWTHGALQATELQLFRLQHWSISEFTDLLRQAGFVDTAVSADYTPGAAPGPGSEIWTFDSHRG